MRFVQLIGLFAPVIAWAGAPVALAAEVITLGASADATIFEPVVGQESASGQGNSLFVGRTGGNIARRTLLRIALDSCPPGSTITDCELILSLDRTSAGPSVVSVSRVIADWTEGPSTPTGGEGGGAPAVAGDVTWLSRTYPSVPWSNAGGDFVAAESATTIVGTAGGYIWSGPGMVADVQRWLDHPSENFGWILLGDESQFPTAKRFGSRTNPEAQLRPVIRIEFIPPAPCVGDDDADSDTDSDDIVSFFSGWELGERDADGDGDTDSDDILAFFASWESGCS